MKIYNFCIRDFNNQQTIYRFNVDECFYEIRMIFSIRNNK